MQILLILSCEISHIFFCIDFMIYSMMWIPLYRFSFANFIIQILLYGLYFADSIIWTPSCGFHYEIVHSNLQILLWALLCKLLWGLSYGLLYEIYCIIYYVVYCAVYYTVYYMVYYAIYYAFCCMLYCADFIK